MDSDLPPPAALDAPPAAPNARSAHALIFLIVFLDLLGVGLIAPLSPYIVERFDTSGMAVAMLTLSYSAAQFIATPILGVLSDRFGRRPVLLFSLIGTGVGYVVFATAGSLPLLFASRALDGASGGNISTAQAYIADFTPPEKRAKAYGLIGAAFGLGFTLGPAFGGLLVPISLMAPVWVAAGLAVVTTILVFFFLPETLPPEKRTAATFRARQLNPFSTLWSVVRMPAVTWLLIAIFLYSFAHAELRTSFGVLLRDKLHFPERSTSWMFAYMGLLAVLVQGGLVRRIAPLLGDRRTALVGTPLAILGYALLPVGGTWVLVAAALTILAIGGGLAQPTMTSLLSGRVTAGEQGRVLGASQSASALALVVGPIAAGQLYDHAGKGWPFWTGAVALVGAFVIIATRTSEPPVILAGEQGGA